MCQKTILLLILFQLLEKRLGKDLLKEILPDYIKRSLKEILFDLCRIYLLVTFKLFPEKKSDKIKYLKKSNCTQIINTLLNVFLL